MSNQRDRKIRRFMHGRGKGWKTKGSKSNQQRHAVPAQTMNQHHVKRLDINKVDLHNHGLHQAKKRIKEECKYAGRDQTVQFCHGFNSGTQIRDFIRNGQLQQALNDMGIEGAIWHTDPGNTWFNRT
ncbi:MAG: hypothetical protein ACO20Y_02855 [Poseidonia sp.]